VYQVYISWLNATVVTPRYQLVNFGRIALNSGQTQSLSTEITAQQMAVYVDGKGFVIEPGILLIYVKQITLFCEIEQWSSIS